ncbi:GNAT family protein [Neobacillus sp.]|uniref:GNAT family N-acetyltransferase n=1 Tax=Neobacillus sp. TaxID=2675273 RepID=UPI00289BAB81|nr:GNAT family protein [Neobacillus sp.]
MFTLKVDHDIELQLLERHHAFNLFQLVEENRDHLREWMPWVDSMNSLYQFESIIPVWLTQFAENSALNVGILYKGDLVGSIGLNQMDWYNSTTSIGYYLAKKAEGHGVITRSVQALLNYCFFQLGLNRVEIRCGVKNKKSQAIPERLGFVKEGIIRDGEQLNGRFHNLIVYSMLAREWKGTKRK